MKLAKFIAALLVCVSGAFLAVHAGEGEIPIGIIAPLSGSLAPYGKGSLDGIELRVNEVNAAGGIGGKKIKLYIEDNKGDKTESKNAYKKLVGTNRVVAVLGPVTSTNTLAVRRDVKKMKVPLITPTATNDKVTYKNDYVFRTCIKDSFQGKVIAQYAFTTLGMRKAACIVDMNSDYSKGLASNFTKTFNALGGKVVAEEGYRQKDVEFGAQLSNIKSAGAELLFIPGYPPEVPLIIKQAKVVGFKGRLCGADGWDNTPVMKGSGDNIVGSFITSAFSREDKRPAVAKFVALAEKSLGKKPGNFEALGYDTASILVETLKKDASPEKIRESLSQVKNFPAVTGAITITADGDAEKSVVILGIVKKGDDYTTTYKETINP